MNAVCCGIEKRIDWLREYIGSAGSLVMVTTVDERSTLPP